MYQIERAYGISRAEGAIWEEQDILPLKGTELFFLFKSLYITLSSVFLAEPVSINVADYSAVLQYDERLAVEIFDDWTDPTPLIAVEIPKYKAEKAVFTDIFRAGYEVQRSIPGAHFTSSDNDELRTEMQVSRIGLDPRLIERYCLVTANGYFYKGEAGNDQYYVPEAGKSLLTSRANHVGLLSFEKIGKIQTIALDKDSILPQAINGKLYDGINVKLPEIDLTNKTLVLVVMGQMQLESDGIFIQIGSGRAVISPRAMYLTERYAESWNKIDWKPVLGDWIAPGYVNTEVMHSDEAMKGIVGHAQTFWVVIDTPNIIRSKMMIKSLPIPGCFLTAIEPKSMLVAGTGFVMEYWKREQGGEWAINCSGVRPGQGVQGTLGRTDLPTNLAITNVPYGIYLNTQANLVDLIADQIDDS